MLVSDWAMARHLISRGTLGWNPYVLFGVDYAGREAFIHPLNIGTLAGLFIQNEKHAFMIPTIVIWGMMGFSMYVFLRKMEIDHIYALIGVAMYMLAPKWVDDGYHGPRFIIGYAILPFLMLTMYKMRQSAYAAPHHYLWMAVLVSLMYLGVGAPFLLMSVYLFGSYYIYNVCLFCYENRVLAKQVLVRSSLGLILSVVVFLGLSAYLWLPFLQAFSYSARSFYGEPTGFLSEQYLGIVFPWINRIFSRDVYDLPYLPVLAFLYPNIYFYFGILVVPVMTYGILNKIWRLKAGIVFFFFYPLAWLVLWNSWVIKVFPILPSLERLTSGTSSETHGHVTMIFSFAMGVSFTLNAIAKEANVSKISNPIKTHVLNSINIVLGVLYVLATIAFGVGAVIINTLLRQNVLGKVSDGIYLALHYYLQEMLWLFLAAFVVRGLIIWLYHKRLFVTKGALPLLVLVVIDFQLCYRIWYPFTNLDDRYSAQLPQNSFVIQNVEALDRIGAFQYALYNRGGTIRSLLGGTGNEYEQIIEKLGRTYYKGYIKPLYEPSFSYFPLTIERSLYSFHESLMPDYFWDFDQALNGGNALYSRQSWIGVWDPHSKLLDVAGIKYLFWYEPIQDARLVQLAKFHDSSYVYLNQSAVPRAYLVNQVEYYSDRQALLQRLSEENFDPRRTVTTEDDELFSLSKGGIINGDLQNNVIVETYLPNQVILTTQTQSFTVLVLNDMYYPGWTAKVNQTPAKIFRVNGVFRAVAVPAGKSVVEFIYTNQQLHTGILVSTVSWVVVIAIFLAFFIVSKKSLFSRK